MLARTLFSLADSVRRNSTPTETKARDKKDGEALAMSEKIGSNAAHGKKWSAWHRNTDTGELPA
jgi:chromosome condensin MukBEF MukE localization factor